MKSFVRSQNPSPAVKHASRAAKRNYFQHRLAWQPIDDAERAHAADLRHGVPGTLGSPRRRQPGTRIPPRDRRRQVIRRLILALAAVALGCARRPAPPNASKRSARSRRLFCDGLSCETNADCSDPARPVCRGGYCQAEK